jgi:hypothetical protein
MFDASKIITHGETYRRMGLKSRIYASLFIFNDKDYVWLKNKSETKTYFLNTSFQVNYMLPGTNFMNTTATTTTTTITTNHWHYSPDERKPLLIQFHSLS